MAEFTETVAVHPSPSSIVVAYKFATSLCHCAINPPKRSYWPWCKDSQFHTLVPRIRGSSVVRCDASTGDCEFSHSDILGGTKIAVACTASECVDHLSTVDIPTMTTSRVTEEAWLGFMTSFCLVALALYVRARVRSTALGKEFLELYRHRNNAASTAAFVLRAFGIGYRVSVEDGVQDILRDVHVTFESGNVVAIMGPSGAGKTSLLDVLAGHQKIGLSGFLELNDRRVTQVETYKNIVAFVAQEDILLPTLTVRDSVMFVARLCLPEALPYELKERMTNWAIEQLGLQHVAHSVVGCPGARGISGGERRRVSIAMALVSNPKILLLDEPTSGLDSYSALQVVRTVASLKCARHPLSEYSSWFSVSPMIIMTIHQPSREVFDLFDQLVLMSQGSVLFQGPTQSCVSLFESVSRPCRPNQNPADYLLEIVHEMTESQRERIMSNQVIVVGEDIPVTSLQLPGRKKSPTGRSWRTPLHKVLSGLSEVEMSPSERSPLFMSDSFDRGELTVTERSNSILHQFAQQRKFVPNSWEQAGILISRSLRHLMGSYHLVAAHTSVTLMLSVFLSYMYQQQGLDLPGALNRAGSITFVLLVLAFSSLSSLELFLSERGLFLSERDNGYYSTTPYYAVKVLFDFLPLRIVPTLCLGCVIYFPMGLRTDMGVNFLWFLVTLLGFNLTAAAQCFCVAMLVPSFGAGALLASLLMLFQFVFGGLMVQAKTIPFALRPFRLASPFFLAFETLMVNELAGQSCTFSPTDSAGNPTGYSVPIECAQYLSNLSLQSENFLRDEALLWTWLLIYLALAWTILRFVIKYQR